MAKRKHEPEWYAAIAEAYLSEKESSVQLAKKHGTDKDTVRRWSRLYQEKGIEAFQNRTGNKRYSGDFKKECVEAYLRGEGSIEDLVLRYGISNRSVLTSWIKKYNANMELGDYDPKREVYMAAARRKTTIEERKEIVAYCLEHDKDYKNTASLFDVSYSQVYDWVRKYLESGEEGLQDRRGQRKTDEEVDELERLRRENIRLKRQLQEKDMLVELLKKVKEFEER